jgi:hypothetical protein
MPKVMPSALSLYLVAMACGCLALAGLGQLRARRSLFLPAAVHRCRARPLFSQVGKSTFVLDAIIENCDDPAVRPGTPFSLRLTRPNRRSDYLFSRVRASVERGHALFVDVEDYLISRKARLCANGWTVTLDVDQASGWPAAGC